ncbi:DUF192 domain-containing protein [Uliginosibacterium gangwonense]|uniref:DUF192 domain-containing protein n=1 Tax=Uliginosibacterium gangwonense TaxID=392736 RepID=UPI0003775C4B|nr:DUF192 domain-containing protein [Uliginosibacterium gangwonense]
MKKWLLAGLALCVCTLAQAERLQVADLSVGMYRIQAEVAVTEQDRETGLMNRKSLAPQAGMLFVFDRSAVHCFWMKNTLLPLSVAFLDETGKIINIADMQPQTEEAHCPARPVRYALEMNQGWFLSHGARAGTLINGIVTPAAR